MCYSISFPSFLRAGRYFIYSAADETASNRLVYRMLAFLFPAIRGMENAAAVFRAVRVFGGRGSGGGAGGGDGDDDMRPELNAALQAEMLTHTARPQPYY